jgi:UTP--glucose-1-phosphate uridylyltransferase
MDGMKTTSPKPIRKAIVPAAGLGTRFLPGTKTVPKEMFPIIDRPIILYIVEEAARAGIEDIVLIAGRGKTAIEDFFDLSYEVEDKLEREGKSDWLEEIRRVRSLANVISVRQHRPLGLGHAVLCGRPVVGDEPFALLLGDEIMISEPGDPTVTEALAQSHQSTGLSTVAIMEVPETEVSKYGIVEGESVASRMSGSVIRARKIIEKPSPGQTLSRWALPGRYVFSAEIFNYLEHTKPGKNGEIQLTDAMTELAAGSGLLATTFQARRYDAGDKFGFLQANIELALERPELSDKLRPYLKALAKGL